MFTSDYFVKWKETLRSDKAMTQDKGTGTVYWQVILCFGCWGKT